MDITDSCLDAETLAAWVDGGLSASEVARAQAHVADCARCQAMIGTLARINSAAPAAESEPARRRWLPWLVPLTAAALAVVVWVVVPRTGLESPAPAGIAAPAPQVQAANPNLQEPSAQADRARESQTAVAPAERRPQREADNAASAALDKFGQSAGDSAALTTSKAREEVAPAAPSARAPFAAAGGLAPASPPSLSDAVSNAREIVSPDPMFRWRIVGNSGGNTVQRSTNGGADWQVTPTGVSSELVAGAAPSGDVCWIVGRAGVVLLSTDGRIWRRVPFPEITDLSGIRARDAVSASVTTSDGRILSTTDAGASWSPGPLQGF